MTDRIKARAALERHLLGSASEASPWHDLGLSKAPIIGGRELNLKRLWQEVQMFGGFATTTEGKLWARVATKLGIDINALTNASSIVK